mgnify:CR=1 FL=1
MSKRGSGDDFDEELINAEFESMVEGLSLDESAPTTYLDELDAIEKANKFIPPVPPKKSLKEQFREAKNSIIRWKDNRVNEKPEDGAEI